MQKPVSAKQNDSIIKSNGEKTAAIPYFPLFVSLAGRPVVVVGAGNIAARRIKTLLQFKPNLRVIAPCLNEEVWELAAKHGFKVEKRPYQTGDCKDAFIAVAATDDKSVNQAIGSECKEYSIPVSVADNQKACTFFFPAIVKEANLVIGITSSGENHGQVRRVAAKLRRDLNKILE
ncbi:MAG: bifunctional precorrin-2 dehydrogenase/sirohydrochlorin ferrochelatase [Clostridia bacterium]|jgi:siroheme synthase-like protein|nr:bifunctional precorrin-2 dehydrogenase/sirohydrochlorin ferrochelatase [Clostridia bacterium]